MPDRIDRQQVIDAEVRFGQCRRHRWRSPGPRDIASSTIATAPPPTPTAPASPSSAQQVVDVVDRRQQRDVRPAAQLAPISSAVAPHVGTAANCTSGMRSASARKIVDAFHRARIHHRDVRILEAAEIRVLGHAFQQRNRDVDRVDARPCFT